MPWRGWTALFALAGAAFVAAGLACFFSPGGGRRASAQTGPFVAIDPATATVAVGDTVDVEIAIYEVSDLYSATVHVTFDPSLLEVVDADESRAGVQVFAGTFPGPSEGPGDIVTNAADNTAGTIDYDFTLMSPAPPASGSGTLATVRFRGKAVGSSAIDLVSATLWDPLNEPIAAASGDGEIEVGAASTDTPTPEPATSTATAQPDATHTATAQPTSTGTPSATSTPRPTSTPQSTVTPRPPQQIVQSPTPRPAVAAAAGQNPQNLPPAGDGSLPSQIWRWFFLFGALILGFATWAFTFRFYARQKEHERFWHRGV